MKILENIEAKDFWRILKSTEIPLKKEKIYTKDSLGRISAQDVKAGEALPGFFRSAVDGYATNSSFIEGASDESPRTLKILGEVRMGESSDISVKNSSCIWVPTGGILPEGADCVIKFEDVEKIGNKIVVRKPAKKFENVIPSDNDLKEDEIVVKKGGVINFSRLHAILSLGLRKVNVYEKIKIGIIPTGSELVEPLEARKIPQIREANTHTLEAILKKHGYKVKRYDIAPDDEKKLKEIFEKSLSENHVTVVSGGSFFGRKDFTRKVVESIEGLKLLIHGVLMMPGKSMIFADFGGKVLFGFPGKPQSFLLLSFSILIPFLENLSGRKPLKCTLELGEDVKAKKDFLLILWAKIENNKVYPINARKSLYNQLERVDGYIKVPKGGCLEKNALVEFYPL